MPPHTSSDARPIWWNDRYDTSWHQAKIALGRESAAVGVAPPAELTGGAVTSYDARHEEWKTGTRYGFGAGMSLTYRVHATWCDALDESLHRDWTRMDMEPRWDDVRPQVRRGFELARFVLDQTARGG